MFSWDLGQDHYDFCLRIVFPRFFIPQGVFPTFLYPIKSFSTLPEHREFFQLPKSIALHVTSREVQEPSNESQIHVLSYDENQNVTCIRISEYFLLGYSFISCCHAYAVIVEKCCHFVLLVCW